MNHGSKTVEPDEVKAESKCPVDHSGKSKVRPKVYNVYGQEINPDNMMPPAEPNQLPSTGQKVPLPTERQVSTIPKAAENTSEGQGHWVYPSEQMFYNALKRKGKADDVSEQDMTIVVQIHNQMNERTWQLVKEWEKKYHCSECAEPRLLRFQGKPDRLSPMAAWRHFVLGYPRPFDRHDWVVDRCGQQVRYVIDYYHEENVNGSDSHNDTFIHVRPAIDSFPSLRDRVMHATQEAMTRTQGLLSLERLRRESAPLDAIHNAEHTPADEEEFKRLAALKTSDLKPISASVRARCKPMFEELGACNDEGRCERAQVGLNHCIATVICPNLAKNFMESVETEKGDAAGPYSMMTACIDRFHAMARRLVEQNQPEGDQ